MKAATAQDAAPATPVRTNLPAESAPLIGRDRETRQLSTMLAESRILTLLGIGGVGKTRLALEVACQQMAVFERGTWFIDLTDLTPTDHQHPATGERVATVVVAALDLAERAVGSSDLERVRTALESRSALLVLDNCEHVISEAARFVAELARRAPGVHMLATSREPLGLPDEHRYHVATLDTEPTEDGAASAAAEFFSARARASDTNFTLDEETTPVVVELCRRLDGLPLALELAAARIRGISVSDLLERLSDRLNLLRRPGHGVPRRQQTLRGMIDWSWSLLDRAERAVLRRVAVHPGSLSLAAAEAICADDLDSTDPVVQSSQVVDVLIGLVDRSMVTATASASGVRYGLLESIATYAEEQLEAAGERAAAAQRHLRYYLDLAQEADQHLHGRQQRSWLAHLEAERTQLRYAFDEAIGTKDGASAVAITVATFWYQWMTGRQCHLHEDMEAAIDLPGPRDDSYATVATRTVCMSIHLYPGAEEQRVADALTLFSADGQVARARAQWFAGASLLAVGVRDAGERHIDEAVAVLQDAGDDWHVAVAASQRDWFVVGNWGYEPRGLPDGRDPETVLAALGDGYGLSQAIGVRYRTAELRGDYARAADAAQSGLAICLDLGLWIEASYWYSATAISALRTGDLPQAVDHLRKSESVAADVSLGEKPYFVGFTEAMIARYRGDVAHARELMNHWRVHDGTATQEMIVPFEDGFLAVQEGHLDHAMDMVHVLHGSIRHNRANEAALARLFELVAAVHAARATSADESWVAAELVGTADAVRTHSHADRSVPEKCDVDRVTAMIRRHLTAAQVAKAHVDGRNHDPAERFEAIAQLSRTGPGRR